MSDAILSTEKIRSVIADALQLRRASTNATRGFVDLRHNTDLCPGVEERLAAVLDGISKRTAIVADIQGVNDNGVDVLVTLDTEQGRRYIGVQIKSEPEAKEKSLLRTIKAAYVDALARYGGPDNDHMLDYYVFLGWDARANLQRTRLVAAELATAKHVRIVAPINAWAFFHGSSRAEVDAIVTASATDVDPLLRVARELTVSLPHGALATLLVIVSAWTTDPDHRISRTSLERSTLRKDVRARTSITEDYEIAGVESWMKLPQINSPCPLQPAEQLARDLDALDDAVVTGVDSVQVVVRDIAPVIALAYDARARFGHKDDALAAYLYDLLTTTSVAIEDQRRLVTRFANMVDASQTPYESAADTLSQLLELNCPDLVATIKGDGLRKFAASQLHAGR